MKATIYEIQQNLDKATPLSIMADWELAKIITHSSLHNGKSDYEFFEEYPHLTEIFRDNWIEQDEAFDVWEKTIEYKGWKFTSVDGVYIENVQIYIEEIKKLST